VLVRRTETYLNGGVLQAAATIQSAPELHRVIELPPALEPMAATSKKLLVLQFGARRVEICLRYLDLTGERTGAIPGGGLHPSLWADIRDLSVWPRIQRWSREVVSEASPI
jgi:hypothetical protein